MDRFFRAFGAGLLPVFGKFLPGSIEGTQEFCTAFHGVQNNSSLEQIGIATRGTKVRKSFLTFLCLLWLFFFYLEGDNPKVTDIVTLRPANLLIRSPGSGALLLVEAAVMPVM